MSDDPVVAGARWRAIAHTDHTIAALDSLTLLYDRRSGQTHLLAPPLPELLHALAAGPASADEVMARLATMFDLGAADAAAAMIGERLCELAAMGLVERL